MNDSNVGCYLIETCATEVTLLKVPRRRLPTGSLREFVYGTAVSNLGFMNKS